MPEENKISDIGLRSEEVKEILGQIPSWIIRWGMMLFLLVIGLIFLGSYIFKYPKIIIAPVKVTTENPPSNIMARTNGQIVELFVIDNQKVEAGQTLALIENTSRFQDVVDLKHSLDSFIYVMNDAEKAAFYNFPKSLMLGELQPEYANFLKLHEDLRNFIQLDYHQKKIISLKEEINRFKAYSVTLEKQSSILKSEMTLAGNQFARDSLLYIKEVIPQKEYDDSKAFFLQKQRVYEESRSILVSNDIEITRLQQQILDLSLQESKDFEKLQLANAEALDNLTAELANWEKKFVLKTFISGIVSFTSIWSENQNVREGDMVMSVIPENAGEIIGKIELPINGAGNVKTGQRVNVKFDNFPYMEYGMVLGEIKSISLVTNNNAYSVLISLPDGLKTSYNKDIMFSQDMQGEAEIITDDLRLIERILNPVRAVLNRQKSL
jgi:multidrug resistance efflux pump